MFWKRPWFLMSMSMVFLMALVCLLALRDVEAVEPPEDLSYEYPLISEADNIYADLILALDELEVLQEAWSEQGFSVYEWNTQEMQKYLSEIEQDLPSAINGLRQAILQKPFYLSPRIESVDDLLPGLGKLRFYYQYESCLMKMYAQQGDWDKVNQKIVLLCSLYNKVSSVNGLIEGLVLNAVRGIQLTAIQEVMDCGAVPESTLRLLIKEMYSSRTWQSMVKQTYIGELEYMHLVAGLIAEGKSLGYGLSDPWMVLMRANVFYESTFPYFEYFVDHLDTPRNKLPKVTPLDRLDDKRSDYWYLIKNRETILLLMILPSLDIAGDKIAQLSWKESFVSLRAACLLYNLKNGCLPKGIDDLVPEYIKSVPMDIYSGKKVQYNQDKAMFYVIGPDLKDDLGEGDYQRRHNLLFEGDIAQNIFSETELGPPQKIPQTKHKITPEK